MTNQINNPSDVRVATARQINNPRTARGGTPYSLCNQEWDQIDVDVEADSGQTHANCQA